MRDLGGDGDVNRYGRYQEGFRPTLGETVLSRRSCPPDMLTRMRRPLALAALVVAGPGRLRSRAQQRPIDWDALTTETVNVLVRLHQGQHDESARERDPDGAVSQADSRQGGHRVADPRHGRAQAGRSRELLRPAQGQRLEESDRARAPHGRRSRQSRATGRSIRSRARSRTATSGAAARST